MANLVEQARWATGIYQIEENDPVQGGANGITNRPQKELANRTFYLKQEVERRVGLSGNETINGEKTFLALTKVAKGIRLAQTEALLNGGNYAEIFADGNTFWITHKGAVWRFYPDGRITVNNKKIYGENSKPSFSEILNVPIASLNRQGIVQLTDAINNTSSSLAASAKAVKTAYDKAVEALNAATRLNWSTLNGKPTTLAGYGITDFFIKAGSADANTYKKDGHYAFTSGGTNLPSTGAWHLKVVAGGDGRWVHQIAHKAYSSEVWERHQTSLNGGFSNWVRIDSAGIEKSSAVNSSSEITLATAKAVKIAYDKGLEAKTSADNANTNANGKVAKTGDTMTGSLSIKGQANRNHGNGLKIINTGSGPGTAGFVDFYFVQDRVPQVSLHAIDAGDYSAELNVVVTPNGNTFSTDRRVVHSSFKRNGDLVVKKDVLTSTGQSLSSAIQASELVGAVAHFARSAPPAGWLKANGAAVSRATYSALFSAIGTTFGAGDGRTTFNLPDLRGEFIRGVDDGRNVDRGRHLGSSQGDSLKAHSHTFRDYYYAEHHDEWTSRVTHRELNTTRHNGNVGAASTDGDNDSFLYIDKQTSPAGETETRPRNVALLACIKY